MNLLRFKIVYLLGQTARILSAPESGVEAVNVLTRRFYAAFATSIATCTHGCFFN